MWRSLVKNFNYLTGQQQHQPTESLSTPRDSTGMQSTHGNEDIELVSMDNRVSPITQAAVSAPKKSMISSIGDYCVGSFKSFIDVCWYDRSDTTKTVIKTAGVLTAAATEAAVLYLMTQLLQEDATEAEQESNYYAKLAAVSILTGAAARFALIGITAALHAFNLQRSAQTTQTLTNSITFAERYIMPESLLTRGLLLGSLYQDRWNSFGALKISIPWTGIASGWRMARLLEEGIAEQLRIKNTTVNELDYFEGQTRLTPYDLKLLIIDSIKLALAGLLIYLGQTSANSAKNFNETLIADLEIWIGLLLGGMVAASFLERSETFRNALTVDRAKFAEQFMYTILLTFVRPGTNISGYICTPLLGVLLTLNAFVVQRLIGHRNHVIEEQLKDLGSLIATSSAYFNGIENQLNQLHQVPPTFFGKIKKFLFNLRDLYSNKSDNFFTTWPGPAGHLWPIAQFLFLYSLPIISHNDSLFGFYPAPLFFYMIYYGQLRPIQYYDFKKKYVEGTLTGPQKIRFAFHNFCIENPARIAMFYVFIEKIALKRINGNEIAAAGASVVANAGIWVTTLMITAIMRGMVKELPALPAETLESMKKSFPLPENALTETEQKEARNSHTTSIVITSYEALFIKRARQYLNVNPLDTQINASEITPVKIDDEEKHSIQPGNAMESAMWSIGYTNTVLQAFESPSLRR